MDPLELLKLYQPKELKQLTTDQHLCNVRFSPCGKLLAAGDFNGRVRRWDATGDEFAALEPLTGHNGFVDGLGFHPEGQWLYTADSWGCLRAWDYTAATPQPKWDVPEAHDGWIHALAVSPDGKWLATCGRDLLVRIWDAETGKKLHDLAGHKLDVRCVLFHPDGKSLASADLSGAVKLWDAATGKQLRDFSASELCLGDRLQDVGGVQCIAFDPAGKALACGGTHPKNGGNVQGKPTIVWFDVESGKKTRSVEMGADVYVHQIHIDARGFVIAVTSGNPGSGTLFLQEIDAATPFFTTKIVNLHSLAMHPGGQRFAVTSTRGNGGNGRGKLKDGIYAGNSSPVHILDFPKPAAAENAKEKSAATG